MSAEILEKLDEIEALIRYGLEDDVEVVDSEPEEPVFTAEVNDEFTDGAQWVDFTPVMSPMQVARAARGLNPKISHHVISVFHRSAAAVRDGKRGISDSAQGDVLRAFIEANPHVYGELDE